MAGMKKRTASQGGARRSQLMTRDVVAGEVRALMGRHRVSQTALAAVLDLSQSSLSARLRSELPFDVDELSRVAAHFDIPITDLFGAPNSAWSTADEVRSEQVALGAGV